MIIREIEESDIQGLLELYLHLHELYVPQMDEHMKKTVQKILSNEDYHIIVAEENGKLVSSCTCVIVPNLTRDGASYALIENVVTHKEYRNKGFASKCLDYAKQIAMKEDCYKMMLITGSHDPKTHFFYQNAGYFSDGKTAYYQLLKEVTWNKRI